MNSTESVAISLLKATSSAVAALWLRLGLLPALRLRCRQLLRETLLTTGCSPLVRGAVMEYNAWITAKLQ
jgi:hypothetical protein